MKLSVEQMIEDYQKLRYNGPVRPSPPSAPKGPHTSIGMRQYSDALQIYEQDLERYKNAQSQYHRDSNNARDNIKIAACKEYTRTYNVEAVFLAWEKADAEADGSMYNTYVLFESKMDFIRDFLAKNA